MGSIAYVRCNSFVFLLFLFGIFAVTSSSINPRKVTDNGEYTDFTSFKDGLLKFKVYFLYFLLYIKVHKYTETKFKPNTTDLV